MEVMNEKEIKIVKNSTIYEIRLAFASGEKEDYKKEEILEMLDKIALAKEQEQSREQKRAADTKAAQSMTSSPKKFFRQLIYTDFMTHPFYDTNTFPTD